MHYNVLLKKKGTTVHDLNLAKRMQSLLYSKYDNPDKYLDSFSALFILILSFYYINVGRSLDSLICVRNNGIVCMAYDRLAGSVDTMYRQESEPAAFPHLKAISSFMYHGSFSS